MNTFQLQFYEAENPFYVGEVVSVTIPSSDGEYSIMASHSHMVLAIVPGLLRYRTPDGEEHLASVSEGILRVENNEALILVDAAEHPEEIDVNRAREREEIAREQMLQKKSLRDYYMAEAALQRAINRLKVSRRHTGLSQLDDTTAHP